MNLQQVAETVARHLLKQNTKSRLANSDVRYPTCAYRGQNGTKCAIGCLIKDEFYDPNIEGFGIANRNAQGQAIVDALEHSIDMQINGKLYNLLERLQDLHDDNDPTCWRAGLVRLFNDFDLDPIPELQA